MSEQPDTTETTPAPVDPSVWERLAAPFDVSWVEKLPKQVSRDDQDKGRCVAGSRVSADGHACGGWHARSVHLDYIGHAGITMRLNDVVGPGGWTLEPVALTPEGLPLMARGEFWARLTVLGVSHVDLAANYNSTQEAWGDALRRTAMRFGIGTYLWAKSEYAAELAAFREPAPGESPADRAQADADKLAEQRWPLATVEAAATRAAAAGYVDESVKFRGNTMTLGGALELCRIEAREDEEAAAQQSATPPAAQTPQETPTAPETAQQPPAEAPAQQPAGETPEEAAADIAGMALALADVEQLRSTYRGSTDLLGIDVSAVVTDDDHDTMGVAQDARAGAVPLGGLLMAIAKYVERHGNAVRDALPVGGQSTNGPDPWAQDAAAGWPSEPAP